MSYTCPDCEDGILQAKVREIPLELKDDETARIVGSVALVTSVRCNNGCSPESEEEEEEPETAVDRRIERTLAKRVSAASGSGQPCSRSELCSKTYGHTGACNKKLATKE